MFGTIKVNVDSVQLRDYADKLENVRDSMLTEIEELKRNYKQAQWNDMVSEKARVQLNQYIDALNFAIGDLNSVIYCFFAVPIPLIKIICLFSNSSAHCCNVILLSLLTLALVLLGLLLYHRFTRFTYRRFIAIYRYYLYNEIWNKKDS